MIKKRIDYRYIRKELSDFTMIYNPRNNYFKCYLCGEKIVYACIGIRKTEVKTHHIRPTYYWRSHIKCFLTNAKLVKMRTSRKDCSACGDYISGREHILIGEKGYHKKCHMKILKELKDMPHIQRIIVKEEMVEYGK